MEEKQGLLHRQTYDGVAKIIKINKDAVREILLEFFCENEESLFQTEVDLLEDGSRVDQFGISVVFLANGDLVCQEYNISEGSLEIDRKALRRMEYTAQSLFTPPTDIKYITATIRAGNIVAETIKADV